MKKILIFSDTHGETDVVCDIISDNDVVDYIIHAGDTSRDAEEIHRMFPHIPIIFVKGNCDWFSDVPDDVVEIIEGKRIFVTHGHKYNVKNELLLSTLKNACKDCDLAVFGHTHKPYVEYATPCTLVNPGSLTYGDTYVVCVIEDGNISIDFKEV